LSSNSIIKFIVVIFFIPTMLISGEIEFTPRVGIVISKSSFEHRWSVTQMSAHGWTGVANLAGIPYDNLFLDDLVNEDILNYNAIILTQCTHVKSEKFDAIKTRLKEYLAAGGNLIIDGPFAIYDDNGGETNYSMDEMLPGAVYSGFYGDNSYRIKVINNHHFVTRNYETGTFVTQHLVHGVNCISFSNESTILLTITNEEASYPYLSVQDNGHSRIMLVSDFVTHSGATSLFRNVHPQVFYKNELFNILITGLQWIVYGDISIAIPAPQLSNANLTSIIRLDADASGNLDAQVRTINYLVDIAKETGVIPLYAWVSSSATRAGWESLAPLGRMIENVGGRIGTHSKFHRIDANMTPERWIEELDGSIEEIELNMALHGYPVKGVEYMINPGNTIRMSDYHEVSRRMSFYMTHGFEQDMPIGFGNMTWYTGDEKNFVVVNNTPSPDYQWFNDPAWSYTTAQITAYQEAIFDHLYNSIGRGLVYNQMWHDYAISTLPQSPKDRIINECNIAMYDAMRAKFKTTDIYASEPEDLGQKIRALKQWEYTWKASNDKIEIEIDLGEVLLDDIPEYTGGMGLRIDNTRRYIKNVSVNGNNHVAFRDNLVILPNLEKGKNTIVIKLDDSPSMESRLLYVSKRMPSIQEQGSDIHVDILTQTRGRFAFSVYKPSILLNADFHEWNRRHDFELRGHVDSDRTLILKPSTMHRVNITYATMAIINFNETENSVEFELGESSSDRHSLFLIAEEIPRRIRFNNEEIPFVIEQSEIRIDIPRLYSDSSVIIDF
jgi:uncharacterized membrane protein